MTDFKRCVLATIVDKQHLKYLDRFFDLAIKKGLWRGDCIILAYNFANDDPELMKYQQNGVLIYRCPALASASYRHWTPEALSYFYLFDEYFKNWENVVYLDVDCVVRTPISKLATLQGFWATSFYHRTHPALKVGERLLAGHDLINDGVLAYSTDIINENTFLDLLKIYQELDQQALPAVYSGGIDELVLAAYFLGRKNELPLEYNVIPNELAARYGAFMSEFGGTIIHHAAGRAYPKPWEDASPFHSEWLGNFKPTFWFAEKIKLTFSLARARARFAFDRWLGQIGIWLKENFPFLYAVVRKIKRQKNNRHQRQ